MKTDNELGGGSSYLKTSAFFFLCASPLKLQDYVSPPSAVARFQQLKFKSCNFNKKIKKDIVVHVNLKIVTEIGARVTSKYSTLTAFRILDIIVMLGHSALFAFKRIFD